MLNNLVLVGRLAETPILEESLNGKKVTTIILVVPRSYKNEYGEYDTDFIPVSLVGSIAETTCEYCRKGDIVGVKGRLARLSYGELQVIADKITFLNSNSNNINNYVNKED